MFNIDSGEFLVVAIAALIFIGPKDLPRAMHFVGKWVGKARAVGRQFRSGIDSMVREAELAELEKQWAAENERIMRQYPPQPLAAPDTVPAIEHVAQDPVSHEHVPHEGDVPVMTPQPEIHADPAPVEVSAPKPAANDSKPVPPASEVKP
ncbi:twin-arginine translocase subunit TatB [Sphingomonas sp. ABOLE]|uniref:twin-arginine translocase subunit TatB n=1 Tax=Sphingomonas sp. ABOLE TaxID=1985878 RepID=UPI000F7F87E6|nr:twin-arginine translocase subunit TatB [Sphingomonas sp. ABOLE]RSV41437.1 twin-arginine translocase subunit TatB [Sphingomonas sp. ABOLE]